MDIERNISTTESTAAADASDDPFVRETARKRQEERDLTAKNVKSHFKPWRVFINHIDSYHGRLLTDVRIVFYQNFWHIFIYISPYIKSSRYLREHRETLWK